MNWKYEAIDKLKLYEVKRHSLENLQDEIRSLDHAKKAIRSATADSVPLKGGGSRREDVMLNNMVRRAELLESLRAVKRWVHRMDSAWAAICEEDRLILDRFYVNPAKGNVERLCSELGLEQASVYRRREKALYNFTITLYGCMEI